MNSTRERPILFSGPMVRALLDGSKTMTRRIVALEKAIPDADGFQQSDADPAMWLGCDTDGTAIAIRCPYGAPGDRLWVRETFAVEHLPDDLAGTATTNRIDRLVHRADLQARWNDDADHPFYLANDDAPAKWKPAIHMRRAFSRIDLEVTAIRVERLQDITEEDARAEGLRPLREQGLRTIGQPGWQWGDGQGEGARDAFSVLWDDINGKKAPWAANPWVWVVSFKRVRPA